MQIETSPALAADPRFGPVIQRANRLLPEVVFTDDHNPRAAWLLANAAGEQPQLGLTLTDDLGNATLLITPRQIQDENVLELGLHKVWSDLLRARSHVLMKRVEAGLRELELEEAAEAEVGAGTPSA